MRRTSALSIPVLALTLALGLVGCSAGADSSQAPELTATPASGEVVTGDGYSYSVPEGWSVQDPSIAAGADSLAVDESGGETATFANNVNVVISPNGPFTADEIEEGASSELEAGGASDVEILDRVTVADSETPHISAGLPTTEATYPVHQYYLSSDDTTYVVTFTFDSPTEDADAVAVAESILASWEWS